MRAPGTPPSTAAPLPGARWAEATAAPDADRPTPPGALAASPAPRPEHGETGRDRRPNAVTQLRRTLDAFRVADAPGDGGG